MKRPTRVATTCLLGAGLVVATPSLPGAALQSPEADAARAAMVDLIARRGVEDANVLRALRTVPRHEFVPASQAPRAYADTPLPIGSGQTISQPYVVALMTELLECGPGDRVLEIGTGSGYQAAVLAEMGCEVFTIEIVPELGRQAQSTLARLGYEVRSRIGDGYLGWPEAAPFPGIIVTAAPESIPEALVEQLANGGRMVIPVGPTGGVQELMLLRKRADGELDELSVIPVRFVPMVRQRDR